MDAAEERPPLRISTEVASIPAAEDGASSSGRQPSDDRRGSSAKRQRAREVDRLRTNLDDFASQLASIRARVADRSAAGLENARLPVIGGSSFSSQQCKPQRQQQQQHQATSSAVESNQLKLPLLRRLEDSREQHIPPPDPYVRVDSMVKRESSQDKYRSDQSQLQAQEQAAVRALQHANQLDEQVRVTAVAFSQSEHGWGFDERAKRYRDLMEMRKEAERARSEADTERTKAQQLHSLLSDPYANLRSTSAPQQLLAPLVDTNYVWLWILASPVLKMSFTPRDETPQDTINGDKELSTHVVYYIARSMYTGRKGGVHDAANMDTAAVEDRPPSDGWICCSMHGSVPVPRVSPTKSSIETWLVHGAGSGHVNGKYILSGTNDFVRKFKSSTGVELFRKRVPILSSLAQNLYDEPNEPPSALTPEVISSEELSDGTLNSSVDRPIKTSELPAGLRKIESDEHDFRSMQRVGAWLGANEQNQRYRRMKAETQHSSDPEDDDAAQQSIKHASVMYQHDRGDRSRSDIAASRPESSAPICREWVLFLNCSKRHKPNPTVADKMVQMKKPGLGCPYRHYYISDDEKTAMRIWAQTKESWLEKSVLFEIIEREANVERVKGLCKECMTAFQQNLRTDMNAVVQQIIAELSRLRMLSVKVLEKIEAWRTHIRSLGFTRYDPMNDEQHRPHPEEKNDKTFLLGWSATISIATGKQLYKGSRAFVSRVKRFCRPEDPDGMKEQHIVYLGYFKTRDEAERAYDDHAATEARRLNTTANYLPRRRSVFRSCGKHFAVESERLGPSFCIECKMQELATVSSPDDWTPPFYYSPGENYILKMADDLDFLDEVPPLKSALNNGRGGEDRELFPLRGNAFLLPRSAVYDPQIMMLNLSASSKTSQPNTQASLAGFQDDTVNELLDHDRIASAQKVLLQELQLHRPGRTTETDTASASRPVRQEDNKNPDTTSSFRIVEAMYWDRCAALKIQQTRPPLAFRDPKIWCRSDVGEWASLVARGSHLLHYIFEENLAAAGKESQKRRKELLKHMRQVLSIPLYDIHSRTIFVDLISAGQQLKGDVVLLEVNNAIKRLSLYDAWCANSIVIQRCYRGSVGRRRAKTKRKALHLSYTLRAAYLATIHTVAHSFYHRDVVKVAMRAAIRAIDTLVYRCAVQKDGEMLVVSVHLLARSYRTDHSLSTQSKRQASCCPSCARRFRVKAMYGCDKQQFSAVRGVCTCVRNTTEHSSERWFIRAYNPANNAVYRVEIDNSMLSQLLSSYIHREANLSTTDEVQPVQQMLKWKQAAIVWSLRSAFSEKQAQRAYNRLVDWKKLSSQATQARKTASVALENSLSLQNSVQVDYSVSIENAKKAMAFAGRAFSEAQAWDPLENANDWKLLVAKRQLQKQLEEIKTETERCRVASFQASYNEQYTRVQVSEAQDRYDRRWLPLTDHDDRAVDLAALNEATTRATVERSAWRVCNRLLTLRDGGVPLRRHLVVRMSLEFGLSNCRVALPELLRRRNCVRRRILRLHNHEKVGALSRRVVISVSRFPLNRGDKFDPDIANSMWISAYDPALCSVQDLFLEWELVRLLTGWKPDRADQASQPLTRSIRQEIANKLLAIAMLDRFTGQFTLEKLLFFQQMRLLRPQILSSAWFQDLQRGRKSGHGDEVLRQGKAIGGRLCVVVVYENWGDLTFDVYHSASGTSYHLVASFYEICELLSSKPLLLRLWVSSVKSNIYTPALLKHILNLVEFVDAPGQASEHLRIHTRHTDSSKRCFQAARTVQGRKVLITVREDASRDFCLSVFDLDTNHTYCLEMERDALKNLLSRDSEFKSNLLRQQHKNKLYDLLVSRLRFQNLTEHPAALSTVLSPLAHSIHIRQSFDLLNRWISSSSRIPLHCVPARDIDNYASHAESSAFASLLYDQLTIVSETKLPFDLNKAYCGTLEWANVVGGRPQNQAQQQMERTFPFMKVDVYVQSHNLFARVRKELIAEAAERQQRCETLAVGSEDWLSQLVEAHNGLSIANNKLLTAMKNVEAARSLVRGSIDQRRQIHTQLLSRVRSRPNPVTPMTLHSLGINQDTVVAVLLGTVDLDLLASCSVFDTLRCSVLADSVVSLEVVAEALDLCVSELNEHVSTSIERVKIQLAELARQTPFEFDHVRRVRCDIRDIIGYLAGVGVLPTSDRDLVNDLARAWDGSLTNINPCDNDTPDDNGSAAFSTAVVIPSDSSQPFEEVFLDPSAFAFSTHSMTYDERAAALAVNLQPVFRDQLGRNAGKLADLHCRRVDDGYLVYQLHTCGHVDGSLTLNVRASAIATPVLIYGAAVFCPLRRTSMDLRRRLVDGNSRYLELAVAAQSHPTEIVSRLQKKGTRSAKLLQWKQFANERIRVARSLKRALAVECHSLCQFDEAREREEATIATASVSFRALEGMAGRLPSSLYDPDLRLEAIVCVHFELKRDHAHSNSWLLWPANPLALERVMNTASATTETKSTARSESVDLRAVQVELDGMESPRRLVFSCRDLQSRRRYVVDCGYHELCQLGLHSEPKCWPQPRLTIAQWRQLAQDAARRLAFCVKNGALHLDLIPMARPTTNTNSPTPHNSLETLTTTSPTRQLGDYEASTLRETMDRCCTLRFRKHQGGILRAAATCQAQTEQEASFALQHEWMAMTIEDFAARENRGLLVLDTATLVRLRAAYSAGTRAVRKQQEKSSAGGDTLRELQALEIGKAMNASTESLSQSALLLKLIDEQKPWWRRQQASDTSEEQGSEHGEWTFADIAEWWRRRLSPPTTTIATA